jgi:hypothetical protein
LQCASVGRQPGRRCSSNVAAAYKTHAQTKNNLSINNTKQQHQTTPNNNNSIVYLKRASVATHQHGANDGGGALRGAARVDQQLAEHARTSRKL